MSGVWVVAECPKCGMRHQVRRAAWKGAVHRCPSNRNRDTYWELVEEGTNDGS